MNEPLIEEAMRVTVGPLLEACWIAGYRLVRIDKPASLYGHRTVLITGEYSEGGPLINRQRC
jgi:hypothetical protein